MKTGTDSVRQASGRVLTEVTIGVVMSSALVAMVGWLWLVGTRDFAPAVDYTALDAKGREALDLRSPSLRPANWIAHAHQAQAATQPR